MYELVIVPTRAASVLERLIAVMVKSEQRVICTSGSCDGEIFLEINGNILYKGRCNVLDRNGNITDLLLVAFSSFHYRNRHCKVHKTMTIDHAIF